MNADVVDCSWDRSSRVLEPAQRCDILKVLILVTCYYLMQQYIDLSMMYHLIRGQAFIKLYIFFNMLEVGGCGM